MAATPILLVLLTRMEKSSSGQARDADEIDEEQPRVIVAGFGRFGQIAGRLLLSSGVKMVILDHDPDHVDTLRKFDMKVFYGDATRVDLLESAGAEKAEVLINAIDDPHVSLELVARVKEHFPHLQIISRARDVDHYIQLRQAGVDAPERETFEAALKSGRMTLEALGLGAYEARERADLFRRFNLQMVEEMVAMAETTRRRGWRSSSVPAICSPASSTKIDIICRWCSAMAGRERKRAGIPGILPMSRKISPLPDANQ